MKIKLKKIINNNKNNQNIFGKFLKNFLKFHQNFKKLKCSPKFFLNFLLYLIKLILKILIYI